MGETKKEELRKAIRSEDLTKEERRVLDRAVREVGEEQLKTIFEMGGDEELEEHILRTFERLRKSGFEEGSIEDLEERSEDLSDEELRELFKDYSDEELEELLRKSEEGP